MCVLISGLVRRSRLLRGTLVGSMFVALILAGPCAGQNVTAPGGVAAGGDVINSPIDIQGIPPETLPGIIEAATKDWRNLSGQQKQTIADLQNKLGVNENALKAFFAVLGEKEVPVEQLLKKLVEVAEGYKEALARAAPNPNDPPKIAKVRDAVKKALEAGQFDRADELLAQLEKLEDAALASRQLERAGTSAQRGRVAMLQLRYRDAARHFAEAAKHVPEARPEIRLDYIDQQASALYRQGDERGDNGALREAIERNRVLLIQRPRDRVPLDWAMTQMQSRQRALRSWASGRAARRSSRRRFRPTKRR